MVKSDSTQPTPRDYVMTLMKQLPNSKHSIAGSSGEAAEEEWLNFECPNKDCKNKGKGGGVGIFSQKKNTGFTNVKSHLLVCYANNKDDLLQGLFDAKRSGERSIDTFFKASKCVTSEAAYLHRWITLVLKKNVPLSAIDDAEWRSMFTPLTPCNLCPPHPKLSSKTLKKVILKVVSMVEEEIKKEMAAAGIGAILSDGWTKFGTHYLGLFASYSKAVNVSALGDQRKEKKKEVRNEVVVTLLSCAPMQKKSKETDHDEDDADVDDETTRFDAQTHVEHFSTILLDYYDTVMKKWVAAHTADNASVNRKFSDITGIPHIGCKNHKLNLEINRMIGNMLPLGTAIEQIHDVMAKIKGSTKKSAALRKLTVLVPKLYNKTRWSGKLYVLERFLELRPMFQELRVGEDAADFEGVITDHIVSAPLHNRVIKWVRMLQDIDAVTRLLQTRLITLAEAQQLLNSLEADIGNARDKPNAFLYNCALDSIYINETSAKLHSPIFHAGVLKIQNGKTHLLTAEEKTACEPLLLLTDDELDTLEESDPVELPFLERHKKRKFMEANSVNNEYRNVDFILGSNAEGERLWSKAKAVLEGRGKMTPYLFESILFLWYNNRLWDAYVVEKALEAVREDDRAERVDLLQEQNDALEELMNEIAVDPEMNNMDEDE